MVIRQAFPKLLLLVTALTALGCNLVLNLEEGRVLERDGAVCTGDTCSDCQEHTDCAGTERCVLGRCTPAANFDGSSDASEVFDSAIDAAREECTEGTFRCEGYAQTARSECVASAWQEAGPCEDGLLCNGESGECAPVAEGCSGREPGDFVCVGRDRVACGPDLVTSVREVCETVAHCTGARGAACLPCVEDQYTCEGDELRICKADQTGFEFKETCDSGECKPQLKACSALECKPGIHVCDQNVLKLCNPEGTGFAKETPCGDDICDATHGECDKCIPDGEVCANATTQRKCDGEGQVETDVDCKTLNAGATPFCGRDGECVACRYPSTSCLNNTTQQTCREDGSWDTPTACVNQTCSGNVCMGVCAVSAQPRCAAAGGSEQCGPTGTWIVKQALADCPVCTGAGVCVACTNGDTRCAGNAQQQTCVNNQWATAASCSNQTCVGKACAGVCAPGQSRCVTGGKETCNGNGQWALTESCALCKEEASGARCVACELNHHVCAGDTLRRCRDDQTGYIDVTPCGAGLCDASAKKCADKICNSNQVTCEGASDNVLSKCNATGSAFTSQTTCSGSTAICDADGNNGNGQCDRCVENARSCDAAGTTRSVCSADGQTLSQTVCSTVNGGATPACLNGECVACKPGDTRCNGEDLMQVCQPNGTWGTDQACGNQTCVGKVCTGVCNAGTWRCVTGPTGRQQCSGSGTWGATQTDNCSICTGAGVCSVKICDANDITCLGGRYRQCNAIGNAYLWDLPCSFCDDANNQCDVCNANTCKDQSTRTICAADGQSTSEQACSGGTPLCSGGKCVACINGATRCDPAGPLRYRQTCGSGAWPTSGAGRQDCFETEETCLYNSAAGTSACGGSCPAGKQRCNADTKNPDRCESNGVWEERVACSSTQICRMSGTTANCEVNMPYGIGNSAASTGAGWASWSPSTDIIYALAVTTPDRATKLNAFKVTGTANGGTCRMALYNNNASNRPGTSLATSGAIAVVAGTNGAPSNVVVSLTKNTRYWIVATCGDSASVKLLSRIISGQIYHEYYDPNLFVFGDPFPNPFPTNLGVLSNVGLSFFIDVLDVP